MRSINNVEVLFVTETENSDASAFPFSVINRAWSMEKGNLSYSLTSTQSSFERYGNKAGWNYSRNELPSVYFIDSGSGKVLFKLVKGQISVDVARKIFAAINNIYYDDFKGDFVTKEGKVLKSGKDGIETGSGSGLGVIDLGVSYNADVPDLGLNLFKNKSLNWLLLIGAAYFVLKKK